MAVFNARAVTLADLALAAALTRGLRRLVVPLGLTPADDRPRLELAASTLLDRAEGLALPGADQTQRAESRQAMVARLARAEPLSAGREAFTRGMVERGVPGWTRRTGPDPCPLCSTLDDGSVLPPSTPMADHPGCSCVAAPVL